jgi:hypothetical protein
MDACLLSSDDDTWQTPPDELEMVRRVGEIFLDPATALSNPTKAALYCALGHREPHLANGLLAPWKTLLRCAPEETRNPLVFLNPPYGRALAAWTEKVIKEAARGAQIITLTPSRTDTNWWQDLAQAATAGQFRKGRITFYDSRTGKPAETWDKKKKVWRVTSAPFPVFYGYFGDQPELFRQAFAGRGRFL